MSRKTNRVATPGPAGSFHCETTLRRADSQSMKSFTRVAIVEAVGMPGAGPIEIGLEIAERADREVERRGRWCKIGVTYPPAASQALRAVVAQSLVTGRHEIGR